MKLYITNDKFGAALWSTKPDYDAESKGYNVARYGCYFSTGVGVELLAQKLDVKHGDIYEIEG